MLISKGMQFKTWKTWETTCDVPNSPPVEGCVVAPNRPVEAVGFVPNPLVEAAPKLLLAGGLNAELVPNVEPDVPNPVENAAVVPAAPTISKNIISSYAYLTIARGFLRIPRKICFYLYNLLSITWLLCVGATK